MQYYYCLDCKKINKSDVKCEACESYNIKPLRKGTSVNVIGTKQKGKIFNMKDDEIKLIIITEMKERLIKEYKPEELQKVL